MSGVQRYICPNGHFLFFIFPPWLVHIHDGIIIISVIVPMLTNYLEIPLIYLTAACFFPESEGVYVNAKLGIL